VCRCACVCVGVCWVLFVCVYVVTLWKDVHFSICTMCIVCVRGHSLEKISFRHLHYEYYMCLCVFVNVCVCVLYFVFCVGLYKRTTQINTFTCICMYNIHRLYMM